MAEDKDRSLYYEDIVRLAKNREIILVDVREPGEIQDTGKIPGSFNVPLMEVKEALQLSGPEFEAKFSQPKPDMDANLVFSCRTNRRCRQAMVQALQMGYHRSKFYDGGFNDWIKHVPTDGQ